MANLTPTPGWDEVFQLETDTPVLGGAGGPDNLQAQALLNRTAFLEGATGSSKVGHTPAGTGAVATTVEDQLLFLQQQTINVKDAPFYAVGDGVADDTAAINAAIDSASSLKRAVYFPAGIYKISSKIQCSDKYVSLIGETVEGTIIQTEVGFTGTAIEMINTSNDGGDTGEVIENMTISGPYGLTSVGIDQKLTSRATIKNVVVIGFNVGIRQIDNFVFYGQQVEVKDCQTNWHLVGSNHNSEYVRCGAVGFGDSYGGVGTALLIEYSGNDNLQSSLAFRGCDFEFGSGDGVVAGLTGTVVFDNCYMEAIGKSMFTLNDGEVVVKAGEYIIKDSTGFLVFPAAANGRIYFNDQAGITSDGVSRIYPSLIKTGGMGQVIFQSSSVFSRLLTTNQGSLPSNLGRSIVGVPFFKSAGRSFGWNPFTGNGTTTTTGDTFRVTCTVSGALGVYQQMTTQPFINRNCLMIIRYKSNTDFSITTVSDPGQTAPVTTLGTLPNTSGSLSVYCVPVAKITDALQRWVEFWKTGGWAINDYLELEEVLFVDSGAIENGTLSF